MSRTVSVSRCVVEYACLCTIYCAPLPPPLLFGTGSEAIPPTQARTSISGVGWGSASNVKAMPFCPSGYDDLHHRRCNTSQLNALTRCLSTQTSSPLPRHCMSCRQCRLPSHSLQHVPRLCTTSCVALCSYSLVFTMITLTYLIMSLPFRPVIHGIHLGAYNQVPRRGRILAQKTRVRTLHT
jgi:hypothetical protein